MFNKEALAQALKPYFDCGSKPGPIMSVIQLGKEVPEKRVNKPGKFQELGTSIGALVDEKNAAYGDSFTKCAEFLKVLYPNGIIPEQYTDVLCMVRIFDKQMRIATRKDAFGETPYKDIAGYAILGMDKDTKKNPTAPAPKFVRPLGPQPETIKEGSQYPDHCKKCWPDSCKCPF